MSPGTKFRGVINVNYTLVTQVLAHLLIIYIILMYSCLIASHHRLIEMQNRTYEIKVTTHFKIYKYYYVIGPIV